MKNFISVNDEINEAAKLYFGIRYVYPYQRLVIHNVLCGCGYYGIESQSEINHRQIVILPTGAGKSLCFMLPGIMVDRPVLMIFPLLSLMGDQERRIRETGFSCSVLRGGQSREEREKIYKGLEDGTIRFLISNPETLLVPDVLRTVGQFRFAHIVIDEAHTVSEWGETFRPAYLELCRMIQALSYDMISAFTATASENVLDKIKDLIFKKADVNLICGNPDRTNIRYSVVTVDCKKNALLDLIDRVEKPLLIFARSRRRVRDLSLFLRESLSAGEVFFYHAGLTKEEKQKTENWFFDSSAGILTATCAYGLGVDKQNIRTVIHYDIPLTVEAYLQESGRGGRDRGNAEAILLFSDEDIRFGKSIRDPLLKKRYSVMLNYASGKICRREYLTNCLNYKSEFCSGCDVCNNDVSRLVYCGGYFSQYRYLSRVLNKAYFKRALCGKDFPFSQDLTFGKSFEVIQKNSEVVPDFIDILYKRKFHVQKMADLLIWFFDIASKCIGLRSHRYLQKRLGKFRSERKS